MRLYLVQHGEATSEEVDPKRPLTEKGRKDVAKTAKFLKTSSINVDAIWHSAKTRAIETAKIFAQTLSPKQGSEQKQGLAPNDPVKKVFDDIVSEDKDIMIIGHLPFLQKLASLILVNSESFDIIGFRKGGVVCLERAEAKTWQLVFAVTPDLLK